MKRLGIDFHDVICDFLSALVEHLNEKYDAMHTRDDITHWDYWDVTNYGLDKARGVAEICAVLENSTHEHMPLVDGSKEGIEELSRDFELHLISSQGPAVHANTYGFLEYHGLSGYFADVHLVESPKEHTFRKLGLVGALDDYHKNLESCEGLGMIGFLYDTPHSRQIPYDDALRIPNWESGVSIVRNTLL